jgi:hypothetical protein
MAVALMCGIPITHRDFSTDLTLAMRNEGENWLTAIIGEL